MHIATSEKKIPSRSTAFGGYIEEDF